MLEFLQNPGVIAALGSVLAAALALGKWKISRKDTFKLSKISTSEKDRRLAYWYAEYYHRARRILIDHGHEEDVDKFLPFEPPDRDLEKMRLS